MITVVFKDGCDYASAAGLMQWDYGQVLRIQGLKLPTAVEIHFSLQQMGGQAITRVGVTKDGVTDVVIPESMLEADKARNYQIYAWIYLADESSGETVKSITLSVKARSKPEGFRTPEDADLFREAIAVVNESAGRAEEAEASAEAWAHGREDYPDRAEDNAAYYAGQAQESAEAAAGSAGAAAEAESTAQIAADVARQSATNALQSEQAAKTAQTGAEAAQGAAEVAEDQARQDAEQVAQDKSAVTQKAQEVESARSEVASNKTAVDKTVQEFGVTAEQAVQDVNDAGTVQVQNIQSAGTSQVQAVDNAGAEQVQAVQAEGAEQVANVQQAAAEIEADREQIEMNRVLAVSSAPGIMESAEGPEIILRDSSDRPFQGLKVYGRSEQKTTTGEQLYPGIPFVSSNTSYATMTGTDDGKITITGTQSVDGGRNTIKTPSFLLSAGTYTVSYIGNKACGMYLVNENNNTNLTTKDSETFVLSEDASVHFGIDGTPGATYNDEFYIMLNEGTTALPWEPYTGGRLSPNPDYPQEMVSAGQVLTTGAQLFDVTTIIDGHYISDFDGSDVGVNGTLCASDYIGVSGMATLYIGQKSNSGAFYDEDKTFLSGIGSSDVPRSIDVPEGAKYLRVTAYIENKDSFMLNEGSAALPWEPYTGGKPGVVDVGIGAEVTGKNLIPFPYKEGSKVINGVTITVNDDGTLLLNGTATESVRFYLFEGKIMLKSGSTYILSGSTNIYAQLNGILGKNIGNGSKYNAKDSDYISGIWILCASGISFNNVLLKPQFEISDQVTAYELYRTPQSLLVTPNGLPGIPVSSGGNYTDADGQQWVCDEVDFGRGKYVQRVWKKVLDGSTDENWGVYNNDARYVGFSTKALPEAMRCRNGFCNQLSVQINTVSREEGLWFGVNSMVIYAHNNSFYDSTLEDFGLSNWKAHLSEHPLEVMTYLDTPIETDLTPEQIAAYAALHTNYPTTVITNNAGAHMAVRYVADTKAYIDARFRELQTALANTQAQII